MHYCVTALGLLCFTLLEGPQKVHCQELGVCLLQPGL
jgi:hypothetical protein